MRESLRESDWSNEVQEKGKMAGELASLNNTFYNSLRGNMANSIGMQGVLGSGNYAYVSKGRISASKRL